MSQAEIIEWGTALALQQMRGGTRMTEQKARVLKKCPKCGKVLGEKRLGYLPAEDIVIIGDLFDDGFTRWKCDCGWEGRPQEARQEIIRKEDE